VCGEHRPLTLQSASVLQTWPSAHALCPPLKVGLHWLTQSESLLQDCPEGTVHRRLVVTPRIRSPSPRDCSSSMTLPFPDCANFAIQSSVLPEITVPADNADALGVSAAPAVLRPAKNRTKTSPNPAVVRFIVYPPPRPVLPSRWDLSNRRSP